MMTIFSYLSTYIFGSICIVWLMNRVFNLLSEANTRINENTQKTESRYIDY
ncbi:hypothetical protein [Bacillus sp. HNG]|uniref:hypothetical protein n=1 Tax=Bacillus sp. HNG TaxID=2293325 RepID=UPI001673E187|nr:hypothetical protein [Bacillus sp. HNG]